MNDTRLSLRFKLLRIVGLTLIVAIVVSGVALLAFSRLEAHNNTNDDLRLIGDILAEKVSFGLSLGQSYADEVRENLESARHHNDIARVCLYQRDSKLYASYLAADVGDSCLSNFQPQAHLQTSHAFTRHQTIYTPVSLDGETFGHLIIESTGNSLQRQFLLTSLAIFGALFVAVMLAYLFGSRQLNRSLQPLSELSKLGERIAANPLNSERAKKRSNDEVGDLVDTINHMLDVFRIENQKLKSSETTFRTLAENSPVGVFLRNSPKNYDYVNPAWTKITGLNEEHANNFSDFIDSEYKRRYIESMSKLQHGQLFVQAEFEFLHYTGDYRYLQEHVSIVREGKRTFYVGTLVDVTDLKKAQNELEKLAYYDPLTHLPNRRFLSDHLKYAFASAEKKQLKIAAFMMDLDNFKRVNDSLGHDAGDRLLSRTAESLRSAVFREDVVARMGGDEFLVLVEGIENINSVEFICKRLLSAMKTDTANEVASLAVSGSIGVALYPDDASTPEELLRFADMALYNSKEGGGNSFSCYSAKLDEEIREQIRLEQKLRHAIDHREIDVFLQPQYQSKNLQACWAEALVRWIDKDEGFIPPSKFIPIAEDSGLIHELGKFVLDRVCEILSQHEKELARLGIEGISVNLSAQQFFSSSLETEIGRTLKKYSINPAQVEFELTESTVTDDMDRAIEIMASLRDVGCRLSIDDFGTGYSSLSYLKRFPITSLKIDRSFVIDLPEDDNDREITCAIINLAHNLGMTVVAEGVETKAQADFLAKHGCEYLQGFYLAKPQSIDDLLSSGKFNK
ncbi:EAL domain-containing protein [Agaribacterium haliotis]|uniref:EAL domain-containing protein n=1 Tax=Agaribacterium haliotis TaxID=2013869 RepID=UPI000BB571BD|nr:EAL domain-containing protein [Agaribacterium haliotis]